MQINNLNHIDSLLDFSNIQGTEYYKFSLLLRKKDNETLSLFKDGRKEYCVRQWLTTSKDSFYNQLDEMIYYTNLFKGRLYLTLDRKSLYKTLIEMRTKVDNTLDHLYFNKENISTNIINKLAFHATSISESSGKVKRWLFDVDTTDLHTLNTVESLCKTSYLCTLPSVNGFHVIATKNFNAKNLILPNLVELKDNALTLLLKA